MGLFVVAMFLPTLKYSSRTWFGWQTSWECIDTCVDYIRGTRPLARPANRMFGRPPIMALFCGVQCLIGFAAVVATLLIKRPTIVWFRLGVSLAITVLALSIPPQMERFRAFTASINDGFSFDTIILRDNRPYRVYRPYARINHGVNTPPTDFLSHRNWSSGYFLWTSSFVLMAAGSAIQLKQSRTATRDAQT